MPNITVNISRQDAVKLFSLINLMVGEGSYKAARQQVQKAILNEVWPEASPEHPEDTDPSLMRSLALNPKQQRALAEGFLAFVKDSKTSGADLVNAMTLAEVCRVSGWVQKHLDEMPVPDFEGELDAEPALLDPEPAPTPEAEAKAALPGNTVPFPTPVAAEPLEAPLGGKVSKDSAE